MTFIKYSCDGENIHPPIHFENVPEGTKSFVIQGNDGWLLWNLPATTQDLPEGFIPDLAAENINPNNRIGYYGPCTVKPSDVVDVEFDAYALDTTLNIPAPSIADKPNDKLPTISMDIEKRVMQEIGNHTIAHAVLKGKYRTDRAK